MSVPTEALEQTLAGRIALFARERPKEVALRHKRRGIWQEINWQSYGLKVAAAARAFWDMGLRAGDQVAILSDNRPEWLYSDLGAQTLGARSVGVYQTSPPRDIAYIINHSGARVLVCEDQEQVDKFMQIAGECPGLSHVLVIEPRGTKAYTDARLTEFDATIEAAREALEAEPEWLAERLAALDPDAPAMIVYTSGTTGQPKGALLSARNVIPALPAIVEALGVSGKRPELVLSYLPLCHVAERLFSLFLPLATPTIVHFGESIDTVAEDLREVSPTVFLGVPRIWERLLASVHIRMQNSSWLKRRLFRGLSAVGRKLADGRREGTLGLGQRVQFFFADLLIFRPLLERLGLRRCTRAITGAAPVAPEVLRQYASLGLTIREGFGMTETAGISHLTRPGSERIGTVGQPVRCMEQRIGDDGEILLRGPTVFLGYLHDEAATRRIIDEDGWLHTGDIGEIDEQGHLRITGRKKEIIITAGGKNLSPEKIENALKTSPYIKEAVAIGDQRKFVAALVQIEFDTVGHWAQTQGLAYTSFEDLSGKPEVAMLMDTEIRRINGHLAHVEQVRRFEVLPNELSQDDGEVTATQKVRRQVVTLRYETTIENMYLEGEP